MAKEKRGLISVLMWIVGVIVSLAVGFGMINGILTIPYVQVVVPIAGWIVVIGALLGVLMVIVDALSK